jgi:hypothetical protein
MKVIDTVLMRTVHNIAMKLNALSNGLLIMLIGQTLASVGALKMLSIFVQIVSQNITVDISAGHTGIIFLKKGWSMIAIINQGEQNADGETLYNLQINNKLITTFYHFRELGLRRCLESAALAMEPI